MWSWLDGVRRNPGTEESHALMQGPCPLGVASTESSGQRRSAPVGAVDVHNFFGWKALVATADDMLDL